MDGDESGRDDEQSRTDGGPSRSERNGYQTQLEALLEALTSRRRRYALYYLRDQEVTDLDSLATHLASVEGNVATAALSDEAITRVKTELVHTELPALADARLIEYDPRSEVIRYSAPPAPLEAFLRLSARIDAPENRPE